MIRRPDLEELRSAAALLTRLAADRGISNLRSGEEPGEVIGDVADSASYLDLVGFEDDVESRLGWRPVVVSSGAPGAHPGPNLIGRTHAA